MPATALSLGQPKLSYRVEYLDLLNQLTLLVPEFNQVGLKGESDDPFRLLFAADVVNARYELTQCRNFFDRFCFHGSKCRPVIPAYVMGFYPTHDFLSGRPSRP